MPKGYILQVVIEGVNLDLVAAPAAKISIWLAENAGWTVVRDSIKLPPGQVRFLAERVG